MEKFRVVNGKKNKNNTAVFRANNVEEEEKVPVMLTIQQTADKSGISSYTVRRWVNEGVLPSITIGRKKLISWSNFCMFLNGNLGGVQNG